MSDAKTKKISTNKTSHTIILMTIPLVIGIQICPLLKNDITLVMLAANNNGISAYNINEMNLSITPSLSDQLPSPNRKFVQK